MQFSLLKNGDTSVSIPFYADVIIILLNDRNALNKTLINHKL